MKLYYHEHESMYDNTKYWVFLELSSKGRWRGIGYLYSKTGFGKGTNGPNSLEYDKEARAHSTGASAYNEASEREAKDLMITIFKVDRLMVDKS
jgi:hypothetical protein